MEIDRVADQLKIELFLDINTPDNGSKINSIERYLRMAYVAGMEQAICEFRGFRPVLWVKDGVVQRRFIRMQQAANYLDIPVQGIRDVVAGNQHTVRVLKFIYATES